MESFSAFQNQLAMPLISDKIAEPRTKGEKYEEISSHFEWNQDQPFISILSHLVGVESQQNGDDFHIHAVGKCEWKQNLVLSIY